MYPARFLLLVLLVLGHAVGIQSAIGQELPAAPEESTPVDVTTEREVEEQETGDEEDFEDEEEFEEEGEEGEILEYLSELREDLQHEIERLDDERRLALGRLENVDQMRQLVWKAAGLEKQIEAAERADDEQKFRSVVGSVR